MFEPLKTMIDSTELPSESFANPNYLQMHLDKPITHQPATAHFAAHKTRGNMRTGHPPQHQRFKHGSIMHAQKRNHQLHSNCVLPSGRKFP